MNLEDKAQLNYYPVEIESSTSSAEPSYNTSSEAVSDSNIQTTGGTSIMSAGAFQSPNYVKGSSGWKIDVLGNVEFSNGYFRGDITGASGTFTGTVTATSGLIGGFSIGSDYIKDVADSFGLASTVTGGNDVRFWAGDTFANRATADLRIYEDGAIIASNIEATGSIFATSGWIGSATALVYESQGINTGTTGWIRGGMTGYNTGTGYFLGYYSGDYVFSIGDSTDTNKLLLWDGSDLIVNGSSISNNDIYGDGSDGDVTISTDTSLTSDMFYNNLTIATGKILNTNGFRVFVKNTLTFQGTGKIVSNGGAGGNGVDGGPGGGTGGTAGVIAHVAGSLPASKVGKIGGHGGIALGAAATDGANGDSVTKSVGVAGSAGGKGGGVAFGAGGTAGEITTGVNNRIHNSLSAYFLFDTQSSVASFNGSAGSGGGGGGATGARNGGGGGGSGATGGFVSVFARIIVTVNGNNYIEAIGGAGGNGGGGQTGDVSYGGGGGGGGSGGIVILVYSKKTGTGTISAAGGIGGTGGTGRDSGGGIDPANAGVNGTAGNTGVIIYLQV
jgi:hypothetical protein